VATVRFEEQSALATPVKSDRVCAADRRLVVAAILLGLGLGGFVDGIVLHQILQWHHMLTDYGEFASFPDTTVRSLEENTLWDGLFHASTWVFVSIGLFLLWHALSAGARVTWRSMVGLLLAGWGLFNVVEGIVDHHILTIHHVRDDVEDPLWWDVGFLAFGVLLIIVGIALRRSDRQRDTDGLNDRRGDSFEENIPTVP
jgi:uncharacterized membrane protein